MKIEDHHQFCRDNRMTVAFIRNKSENDYLSSNSIGSLRLGAIWNQLNHSFEWTDGSYMNYTNWKWSRTFGINCTDRCCTVMMDRFGKWNVCDCSSESPVYALCQQIIHISHIDLKDQIESQLKNLTSYFKAHLKKLQEANRSSQTNIKEYRPFLILLNVPILILICFCLGYKYYCKMKHTYYVNGTNARAYIKSSEPNEKGNFGRSPLETKIGIHGIRPKGRRETTWV